MIAGTGMGLAGGGTGLGMLRTRRRDISIKPNRKLDRKSHRGMIYENEELRLRTIHINAEVEQGQNDIKKLRRENEQLRREIWSLRDEYDKLEEILKKQKSREDSGEPEDRSGDEAERSEYSEDDDEEDDEDVSDNDDSDVSEDPEKDKASEETNSDATNLASSPEKSKVSNDSTPLRIRMNFEDLAVVKEEEESVKNKDTTVNNSSSDQIFRINASQQVPLNQKSNLPFYTTSFDQVNPQTTISLGQQTNCPFVFPHQRVPNRPTNPSCMNEHCISGSSHTPICSGNPNKQPGAYSIPKSIHALDGSAHNHCWSPLLASTPPPAGWQSNMVPNPGGGSTTATNFPIGGRSQSPVSSSQRGLSQGTTLGSPKSPTVPETIQPCTTLANCQDITEKMRDFCPLRVTESARQNPIEYGFKNHDPATQVQILENGHRINANEFDQYMEHQRIPSQSNMMFGILSPADSPSKHLFAPSSLTQSHWCSNEDAGSTSENSVITVVPGIQNRLEGSRGTSYAPVEELNIGKGDAKAFFSSENLSVEYKTRNRVENESRTALRKSMSCQDLSALDLNGDSNRLQKARSETILNNAYAVPEACKSRSHLSVKQPDSHRSSSPDVPEIPKLPSINYKLFNNPFLQNFEQVYQNFPVRAEGSSPITHPLSIQVCESPVSSASPVRMQPTFISPSMSEADCHTCKRKDFERLRLIIPPSKLIDHSSDNQQYQVTSFEMPSPHTLQIPPLTPYELEALRTMPTGTSPVQQQSRLYRNVPFVPRSDDIYPSGQDTSRMLYDTSSIKVPAQTQTSLEEDEPKVNTGGNQAELNGAEETNDANKSDQPKKKRSFKEKSGSVKDKCKSPRNSQRRKNLKKQTSVTSKDVPDSPGRVSNQTRTSETRVDKNESRSSSSGHESPKKDQTKRVSLYLSTKKRPSLSSSRTSRSISVENAKEKRLTRLGALEGDNANSERERTNSISSREALGKERSRKSSISSGSVPWCACWGNGCF